MVEPVQVRVSRRYQISLPRAARQKLNIQAGDCLLVDVQDGVLVLLPRPQDMAAHIAGLHKEVWEGIDAMEYLRQERESWDDALVKD